MTTTAVKNVHFICKLKMESEIACDHTVTLTATPSLVIDKAGAVAPSLTYGFAAGAGLVEQDIGVLGIQCGGSKIFAEITSPYFTTPDGLKVKKDKIDIIIECEPPEGWSGERPGAIIHNSTGAYAPGTLQYRYTATSIGGILTVSKTKTAAHSLRVRVTDPTGIVTFNASIGITKIGAYVVEAIEGFALVDSLAGNDPLGTTSWRGQVTGNPTKNPDDTVSRASTGLDRKFTTNVVVPPLGPFPYNINESGGQTIQANSPGVIIMAPPLTRIEADGITITYSGQNCEFTAVGGLQANNNPGAVITNTGLSVGGVIVFGSGSAQMRAVAP